MEPLVVVSSLLFLHVKTRGNRLTGDRPQFADHVTNALRKNP